MGGCTSMPLSAVSSNNQSPPVSAVSTKGHITATATPTRLNSHPSTNLNVGMSSNHMGGNTNTSNGANALVSYPNTEKTIGGTPPMAADTLNGTSACPSPSSGSPMPYSSTTGSASYVLGPQRMNSAAYAETANNYDTHDYYEQHSASTDVISSNTSNSSNEGNGNHHSHNQKNHTTHNNGIGHGSGNGNVNDVSSFDTIGDSHHTHDQMVYGQDIVATGNDKTINGNNDNNTNGLRSRLKQRNGHNNSLAIIAVHDHANNANGNGIKMLGSSGTSIVGAGNTATMTEVERALHQHAALLAANEDGSPYSPLTDNSPLSAGAASSASNTGSGKIRTRRITGQPNNGTATINNGSARNGSINNTFNTTSNTNSNSNRNSNYNSNPPSGEGSPVLSPSSSSHITWKNTPPSRHRVATLASSANAPVRSGSAPCSPTSSSSRVPRALSGVYTPPPPPLLSPTSEPPDAQPIPTCNTTSTSSFLSTPTRITSNRHQWTSSSSSTSSFDGVTTTGVGSNPRTAITIGNNARLRSDSPHRSPSTSLLAQSLLAASLSKRQSLPLPATGNNNNTNNSLSSLSGPTMNSIASSGSGSSSTNGSKNSSPVGSPVVLGRRRPASSLSTTAMMAMNANANAAAANNGNSNSNGSILPSLSSTSSPSSSATTFGGNPGHIVITSNSGMMATNSNMIAVGSPMGAGVGPNGTPEAPKRRLLLARLLMSSNSGNSSPIDIDKRRVQRQLHGSGTSAYLNSGSGSGSGSHGGVASGNNGSARHYMPMAPRTFDELPDSPLTDELLRDERRRAHDSLQRRGILAVHSPILVSSPLPDIKNNNGITSNGSTIGSNFQPSARTTTTRVWQPPSTIDSDSDDDNDSKQQRQQQHLQQQQQQHGANNNNNDKQLIMSNVSHPWFPPIKSAAVPGAPPYAPQQPLQPQTAVHHTEVLTDDDVDAVPLVVHADPYQHAGANSVGVGGTSTTGVYASHPYYQARPLQHQQLLHQTNQQYVPPPPQQPYPYPTSQASHTVISIGQVSQPSAAPSTVNGTAAEQQIDKPVKVKRKPRYFTFSDADIKKSAERERIRLKQKQEALDKREAARLQLLQRAAS